MDNEIKKAMLGDSGEVMAEVYKDLAKPSVEPVGVVLSLLPRTIRLAFSKWEKWIINGEESLKRTEQALHAKVEKIPEEKLCEPEPYVAIPAIQQIAYCFDSEVLREMYANLLASSMNLDKKWGVHPSFVDIIKQITPDEAKLLKCFPRSSIHFLPLVDLKVSLGNGKGEKMVERHIVQEYLYEVCDAPENMSSYLENLERLQLIRMPEDQRYLTEERVYKEIDNSERVRRLKKQKLPEGQVFELDKRFLYVTDFGLSFIRCCIDE